MASIELIKGSDGSGNANVATVQNTRSPGASTIIVDTVLGINADGFAGTMGTPHTFTDPITSETITVISEATAVDFTGHVDGSNLEIDDIAPGYVDAGSQVGDIIIIRPTTQYADNVAETLEVAHNDDGTLKNDAVTTNVIDDDAVTTSKIVDLAVTPGKIDFTKFSGTTTQWRAWTPTLTNFTGTVVQARYTLVGKICHFYIEVLQGASVTGRHTFSLPVTAASTLSTTMGWGIPLARGSILDSGSNVLEASGGLVSTTTCGLMCSRAVSVASAPVSFTEQIPTNATTPMTWANGSDKFWLYGSYEVA